MAAYGYMDHNDPAPDARTAAERVAACGYPLVEWGENIATGYATAQAVVDAWLASPEHRANIERPEFRATGVGAAGAPVYWSQTFGVVAPQAASTALPIRVSCAQRGRGVACRVRGQSGALVRIALMRSGRTFARARTHAAPSAVRVRLHPMRRLRAGRYALVVRAGPAARAHALRMSLVLR